MWESKFGGEARVRVVVGISSEVRRGSVGGEARVSRICDEVIGQVGVMQM